MRLSASGAVGFALVALTLLGGCGGPGRDDRVQQEPVPVFQLTLATGGGFTGMEEGLRLRSTGAVEAYSSFPGGPETISWKGTLPPDTVKAVWWEFRRSGAEQWHYEKPGNVYAKVVLSLSDSVRQWVWDRNRPPEDMPPSFGRWYQKVRATLRRAAKR